MFGIVFSRMKVAGIIVVILLLLGGGFWFVSNSQKKNESMQPSPTTVMQQPSPTAMMKNEASPSANPSGGVMGSESMAGEKTIAVEAGAFYFKPNEIRVKKGQKVKITVTNAGGLHDFVLDEFSVKTERLQSGQIGSVEFTPDKTGTFEYYCSVGNHRAMGMTGKLIVE